MKKVHFTRRLVIAGVMTAVSLAVSPPAGAQDRLFVGTGELGAFGHFAARIGDAPGAVHGRLVAGGRYVVFDATVFDTRTGQQVPMPQVRVLDVDPVRPRVFVKDDGFVSVWHLEWQTLTTLAPAEPDRFGVTTLATYAPTSDELFVWRRDFNVAAPPPMSVIDVGRAVETRTLALRGDSAGEWRVTPDGTRLVVPYGNLGDGLVLYDGRTGATLATQTDVFVDETPPVYDERFDRWYVVTRAGLTAFDGNLARLASVPFEVPGCGARLALSLHTDRLYVTNAIGRRGTSGFRDPMRMRLRVFDRRSGTLLGESDITSAAGVAPNTLQCRLPGGGGTTVLTAPGPPRGLVAAVSGGTVALSWTRVGDATDFVLEAGVAPGRSDMRVSVGGGLSAMFAGVPPGTYHVRVRAANRFGVSRPSNEVAVVVP